MNKKIALLATLPLLAACNRVPVGVLSIADGSEAAPRVVDSNSGNRAERDLKRLSSIDTAIQASLNRLDAALDPANKQAANLEKLVVGDGIDPALASNRYLRQQAQIDQKFDEKNQALIDNTKSGNLDNLVDTGNPDPATLTREQRLQAQIDKSLDQKAQDAIKEPAAKPDAGETAKTDSKVENTPAEKSAPAKPELQIESKDTSGSSSKDKSN